MYERHWVKLVYLLLLQVVMVTLPDLRVVQSVPALATPVRVARTSKVASKRIVSRRAPLHLRGGGRVRPIGRTVELTLKAALEAQRKRGRRG